MKKLLLIFLLVFPFFVQAELPFLMKFAEIDERLNDVYYVNGVISDELQTEKSLTTIKLQILDEIFDGNETAMLKEVNFDILFIESHSSFEKMIMEFKEQKLEDKLFWIAIDAAYNFSCGGIQEYISSDGKNIKNAMSKGAKAALTGFLIEIIADPVQDVTDQYYIKNTAETLLGIFTRDVCAIPSLLGLLTDIDNQINYITQRDNVKQNIMKGHQAIFIAHAQGNYWADRIYKHLKNEANWMTSFVRTISVSSPTALEQSSALMVTFDNDMMTEDEDSIFPAIHNPSRMIYFVVPDKDIDNYDKMTEGCKNGIYLDNEVPTSCNNDDRISVVDVKSTLFGLFDAYMKENLYSSVTSNYVSNPAREKIIDTMKSYIVNFRYAQSQWKFKTKASCSINSCADKVRTVTHRYDTELDEVMNSSSVYPFDEDGKIYPLPYVYDEGLGMVPFSNKYAKSRNFNGEILRDYFDRDDKICFEMGDINRYQMGQVLQTIKKDTEQKHTTPANGYVEVSVSWENADVDIDLLTVYPGGMHDVKDECQPLEHFYALTDKDVTPGLYPIYVTYKTDKTLNASLKEMQDIVVTIKVPGATEARTVNLKTIDSLSNGHIADIKVEERKVEVVLIDDFKKSSTILYYRPENGYTVGTGSSGGYSGGYTGGSGSSRSWTYTYTPPPVTKDYIYSIIWHISQALLGPLAGANVSIYALEDYNFDTNKGSNPVYSDVSSYGSSIHTAGVINIQREIIDSLSDDKLYIVEAKGGADVDANDDKIVETSPTTNLGTIRAVTSGSALKNIGFKLNILTEMAYQISKKHYDKNDISRFIAKSDEAVKCLLNGDINLDNATNTMDALYFTPYEDMGKLYRDYRSEFMPLIGKIHKGNDIYEDSFNLYAKPLVKGGYFSVNEDVPIGTIIGKIDTDCVSESLVHLFSLSGTGSENFEVDGDGNLKVVKQLVYENRRIYTLQVTGINSYGSSPASNVYITVTADNTPVITSTLDIYIFENMPNGSHIGTISVNDMGYPVTGMRLEGYGAEYFSIDKEGKITVTHGENITLSDKAYTLRVTASNAFGDSASSPVKFTIHDDVPVILNDIAVTIKEDIAKGTAIAKPSYYYGLSSIKEFKLEGYGAENFNVSIDGTIRVSYNANISIDNSPYRLYISAKNEQGISEPKMVTVNVISSVVDNSVYLSDFSANVYADAGNNSVVGKIAYSYGYTPPKAFSLSGVGSERFGISSNGVITLLDNTNLNPGDVFDLQANASNAYTSSTKVPVKITVIDDYLTLYNLSVSIVEGLDTGTAIGKIGYSYGVSPAVSFELEGNDAVYFTVDNGGVIKLSSVLNYDTKQEYSFDVKAVSDKGKTSSSKVTVKIIDDAPVLSDTTLNIMENSYGGEIAGYVRVSSSGKSSINSFTLTGEGNEHFNINDQGVIKVTIGANIDYETKPLYSLKAIAKNSHDTSKEVTVTINVVNVPDQEPILIPTTLSIDENSPAGTYIGDMGIYAHGHSTITSFEITGTNADWFSIDSAGKITTTELANLDYESSKKVFNLKVKANSSYGSSTLVDLTINVNNVPDVPPTVNSANFYVNENSHAETFVGQLTINDDGSPVTSITLSGTGALNFKVYDNGTIVVAEGADLDYEKIRYYYLSVQAVSNIGSSNTVTVRINLNNLKDTPPALRDTHFSVHRKTLANKTIGTMQVVSADCDITEYALDDNSVFSIKNNGEVYTNTAVTEDSNYTMNVYAKSSCGDSDTVKLTVDTENRIIGQFATSYALDIAISSDNTKAFVISGVGLRIIDVSDPANPVSIGQFSITRYGAHAVTLSSDNTKAFVADDYDGLKIIDVRNPTKSTLIGEFATSRALGVTLSSDNTKAFVGDWSGGLKIIDVSNPSKLAFIGEFATSLAQAIALSSDETKAFVADVGSLKIIDVSDPSKPAFIGEFATSHALRVALSSDNTKAFVADGDGGLKIIDISDPSKPELIGSIGTFGSINSIALSLDETKAFVGDYSVGLKIIDVSDPIKPALIGQIGISNTYDVALSSDETKAFVVGYYDGLKIIDIEDFTKE
jgi:hypothetical protein